MYDTAPRRAAYTACIITTVLLLASLAMVPAGAAEEETSQCSTSEDQPIDILFAFDTSRSMSDEIDTAKAKASDMLDTLDSNIPDATFALASFSDYQGSFKYPGYAEQYGNFQDYPWRLDRDFTADTTQVDDGIQDLTIRDGVDLPESYSRAFFEATQLQNWRPDAIHVMVLWGDSHPHDDDFYDETFGLDPGPDATAQTSDDIDFQDVIADLSDAGIHVLAADASDPSKDGGQEHVTRVKDTFWYAANQTRPNEDVTGYAELQNAGNLADTILDFVSQVAPTDPPELSVAVPEEGRLYDQGSDQGPAPHADLARLMDDQAFEAQATSQCPVDKITFEVEDKPGTPGFSWDDTGHGPSKDLTVTTDPFPAATAPEGLYTLNVTAVDVDGQSTTVTVDLEIVRSPTFTPPSPCATGEAVDGISHQAITDVGLAARSPSPVRTVSLSLVSGPGALSNQVQSGNTTTADWGWDDPQVGTYTVTLQATDSEGETQTCTFDVEVENIPPDPDFDWTPEEPTEDQPFDLTDTSTDENGEIDSCEWTLEGESDAFSDVCQPTVTFEDPGDHRVCLTVTDDDGDDATRCKTITVLEIDGPEFLDPSPCGETLDLTSHEAFSAALKARSPSPDRTVTLSLAAGPGQLSDHVQDGNTTTATWSWDDPTLGLHTVEIVATDSQGDSSTCLFDLDVTNPPPVAAFTWTPGTPFTQDPVGFQDESTDANGQIVDWQWTFDDGATSTVQHPDHPFADAGVYEVCLTVTDDDGATDTVCHDVEVLFAGPPVVGCPDDAVVTGISQVGLDTPPEIHARSPAPDRTVALTKYAGPGQLVDVVQDGNETTATLIWPDPHPGFHDVVVNATDSTGQTTQCKIDLDITNPPPEADFSIAPRIAMVENPVQFTDLSTDSNGEVVAWNWSFGDREASALADPEHTYDQGGDLTVTLTVWDDEGAKDSVSKDLTVLLAEGRATGIVVDHETMEGDVASLQETLADTTLVRTDTQVRLPQASLLQGDVSGASGLVDVGVGSIQAVANVTSVSIPFTVEGEPHVLDVVDLSTEVAGTCQGIDAVTSIGQILLDGEPLLVSPVTLDEPMALVNQANVELILHQTNRGTETIMEATGVHLRVTVPGSETIVDLASTRGVVRCSFGDIPDDPGPVPSGPLMTGRAQVTSGQADTGWVTTAGPLALTAASPGSSPLDPLTDHRTQARSELVADVGTMEATSHLAEHVIALDEIPGLSGPPLAIHDATARANATCDQASVGSVTLGGIVLGETTVYEGSQDVPANTVVPLPGIGELVLNRQTTDQEGNITVTAVELRVTTNLGEQVVPVGTATADVAGCEEVG